MELYDVVLKIMGDIKPTGDSTEDYKRINNIQECEKLIEYLIDDLIEISNNKGSSQYTVDAIGFSAYSKLKSIAKQINDKIE